MSNVNKRILAVVPLISLMLFLISGLYYEKWNLGWTFFLLIPISSILLTGNPWKRLSEMMPLISLTVFLWIGFGFGLWHPGWIVFLLIPIVNLIVEKKINARKLVGILVVAAYITLGFLYNEWDRAWILFFLIPIINTIFFPQKNAYFSFTKENIKSKINKIIIDQDDDKDDF
ncbi:MAG: hypothetical protein CVV57_08035 [Tenericutes bacterium HGW-Tenericutes-2]|jgi:hypothetical protein|nr:MAG: hypothetical protein CVV57_08035 [Tenericutes bacterium HGW-Tenericutes-2]